MTQPFMEDSKYYLFVGMGGNIMSRSRNGVQNEKGKISLCWELSLLIRIWNWVMLF